VFFEVSLTLTGRSKKCVYLQRDSCLK